MPRNKYPLDMYAIFADMTDIDKLVSCVLIMYKPRPLKPEPYLYSTLHWYHQYHELTRWPQIPEKIPEKIQYVLIVRESDLVKYCIFRVLFKSRPDWIKLKTTGDACKLLYMISDTRNKYRYIQTIDISSMNLTCVAMTWIYR